MNSLPLPDTHIEEYLLSIAIALNRIELRLESMSHPTALRDFDAKMKANHNE